MTFSWKELSNVKRIGILAIVVSLILTAGFVLYDPSDEEDIPDEKRTAKGKVTIEKNHDGNYNITVDAMNGNLGVGQAEFFIVDVAGSYLDSGTVESIYGLNFDDEKNNITFIDADHNGKVTVGDYFLLRCAENNGTFSEGFRFRVEFTETGRVSFKVTEGEESEQDDDDFELFGYGLPFVAGFAGIVVGACAAAVVFVHRKRNRSKEMSK